MFNFLKLFTKKRHNFFYLADLWYGMLIVYFTQYMVLYECLIEQNNDEQNIDEHKNIKYIIIHQTASNIIILFVMFLIKINLLAFSGYNAIEEVKIVDRFSESIQEF